MDDDQVCDWCGEPAVEPQHVTLEVAAEMAPACEEHLEHAEREARSEMRAQAQAAWDARHG